MFAECAHFLNHVTNANEYVHCASSGTVFKASMQDVKMRCAPRSGHCNDSSSHVGGSED